MFTHNHIGDDSSRIANRIFAGNHFLVGTAGYKYVEPHGIIEARVDLIQFYCNEFPFDILPFSKESYAGKTEEKYARLFAKSSIFAVQNGLQTKRKIV